MENKLTTDVTIDVEEAGAPANTSPIHGKVFQVERITPTQATAMAAKGIGVRKLGKNVYAINKPLNDCRYKGVYIAHIDVGGTQVFYLWCDAGRHREPLGIWKWDTGTSMWKDSSKPYNYVCRLVRKRHRSG